jgi:hypothetical protein
MRHFTKQNTLLDQLLDCDPVVTFLQLAPHGKVMPTSDTQSDSTLINFVTQSFFLFWTTYGRK